MTDPTLQRCANCGLLLAVCECSADERRAEYERQYVEWWLRQDDGDDGVRTCKICQDRYTTSESGVCDHCRRQAWLDANA